MWLRDDLPKDMPMARIMTYGYNSSIIDSNSYDRLDTLADKLNFSLKRLADAPTLKPLILIAHSMGGLIVKQVRPNHPLDPELFGGDC